MLARLLLALALVAVLVAPALATVPAPPLDERDMQWPSDFGGPVGMLTMPPDLGPFNYLRELDQIAHFLARWQVSDTVSPNYGGMIEAESGDLGGVIQTDNTLEAIWVWSRYRELTGRTTFDANVAAAWVYALRYPAWLEEGSVGDDYYRVHNCAWGLAAVLKYQAATGDLTYASHAASCGAYIRSHSLNLGVANTWTQRLYAFCKGWAAGNLYLYAEATSDAALLSSALTQGQNVLTWLNAAPSQRCGWEYWAMSSGTCVWGVCNSVFRADPAAGVAWIAVNGGYVDAWQDWYTVPGYVWDSSWNVAYANAHFAMSDLAGPTPWYANAVTTTNALLSLDTDDDGGITAESIDLANEDMCWVSSYLAKFCVDRLIGTPAQNDAGILRFVGLNDGDAFELGQPIPVRILATNFGLADQPGVEVELSGAWGGASYTRNLSFAAMDTITVDGGWVPAHSGTYVLTAVAHTANDADSANDAVTVTLHVGNLTATPDDVVAVAVRPTMNPFGHDTGLSFALPRASDVRVEIFDARGRRVARLQDGQLEAGLRTLTWNGRDDGGREVPSGVYLYRARIGAQDHVGKLLKSK
jgi:hypothetical protein